MRREQGLKTTEEGGTEWPTATSPAMDGSMVMGCAGGREGRNAFLILKKKRKKKEG